MSTTALNIDTQLNITDANRAFWAEFYTRHALRSTPSPFAQWCLEHHLSSDQRLLELGCGNGRDSFTLMAHGLDVLAVDGCVEVIEDNQRHHEKQQDGNGQFIAHDLGDIEALEPRIAQQAGRLLAPTAIYSRFFLHAVPEAVEDRILAFSHRQLPQGGLMLHEFRTTQDPLFQQGEALSATERWTDHYRRFIDTAAFRDKLARLGFEEISFYEGHGMAKFGDEDPVVARVVVRKK